MTALTAPGAAPSGWVIRIGDPVYRMFCTEVSPDVGSAWSYDRARAKAFPTHDEALRAARTLKRWRDSVHRDVVPADGSVP